MKRSDLPGIARIDRAVRRTFLSLRNRNFRLFFIGQLISNTGNWLTNVAIVLLVLKLTSSGLSVGLISACQFGPILLLSAWAGAVADRSDKRKLLFVTQGLEMMQSCGLAVLAFSPRPPLAGVYALAVFGGILLAFDNPLRRSFVSEMVRAEDVPNAVVLYNMIVNISRVFGPALAGLLVVTLGYGWSFTIDAITYVAVLICLYLMRPAELHRQRPRPRGKGEVRAGVRYVLSMPRLWISFAMLAAIGTLSYNFSVTLVLLVHLALRRTDVTYTILFAVFAVGAVMSGLLVAHRGFVQLRHIILGAVALGVTMLLLAFVPNLGFAIPAVFLVGMTSVVYMTPEMRGRVLSLQTVLFMGTTPIGGPILGWLADATGGRTPLILGGVVALLAGGFGYYAARRYGAGASV